MWEIEIVERAGTFVLIFYKTEPDHDAPVFKDVRGQIICNDQAEADLWQTVLPILNFKDESQS